MSCFICPVCGGSLEKYEKTLKCENNHSFDMAKQGYVNLLMSNASSSKRHGDDKAMVQARTRFLEGGYYAPLCRAIEDMCIKHSSDAVTLLDCGCGECWYTSNIRTALINAGKTVRAAGIDISKHALMAAGRRDKNIETAVASIASLPLADNSCDIIISVFAPINEAEFARILKPNGVFIRAVPMEQHLMGLKRAIYDKPYENPPVAPDIEGFSVIETKELKYSVTLPSNEAVQDLFMMTPYYYKTGAADQAKLNAVETLETEIEFEVIAYKKP